ncbi:MAG: hypothetical protein H7840_03930 [Alphaproteobacteria bacterium]
MTVEFSTTSTTTREEQIAAAALRYAADDIRSAADQTPKWSEPLRNMADLMHDLAQNVLEGRRPLRSSFR